MQIFRRDLSAPETNESGEFFIRVGPDRGTNVPLPRAREEMMARSVAHDTDAKMSRHDTFSILVGSTFPLGRGGKCLKHRVLEQVWVVRIHQTPQKILRMS